MSEHILVSQSGQVRQLILNRADKKNALTLAMYNRLSEALLATDSDPEVRVIVLRAEGDSFCAGNDIADFVAAVNNPDAMQAPLNFLRAISGVSKPLIAAVSGAAVGIGSTMLLHCDLVVASQQTRFQLPFVKLGLVPEGGSSLIMPQLAGHRKAFELLVLGEPFDAETSVELGLVNQISTPEQLQQRTMQLAEEIAALAPEAVRQSKALLKQNMHDQLQQVIQAEGELFAARLHSAEAQEALQAFIEKRSPDFSRF
ncbi:MAG: enoyl-CoA hydratase [Amphritea sp.]|nr:enoyl-CoA hydratase [Amphritea sp.]